MDDREREIAEASDNVVVLRNFERAMRTRGQATQIAHLAEAAGLDEEVIHGRFPGGRDEIVGSVIASACDEFDDVVTQPMIGAPTIAEAMREAADGLAAYYEGGARHCLFDLFSVPSEHQHATQLKGRAQNFLAGLTSVLARGERTEAEATAKAHRLFAELQGTLILGRLTGDPGLFRAFTESLARTR